MLGGGGGRGGGLVPPTAGVGILNAAGFVVSNRYLTVLFGGGAVHGTVSTALVVAHMGAALALGLWATIKPLRHALRVSPVEAMRQ